MQATRATERRKACQDSESQELKWESNSGQAALHSRYGRIGISAVAAAVSHKGEAKLRVAANSNHALRYERE
jgi:hypothetical protein